MRFAALAGFAIFMCLIAGCSGGGGNLGLLQGNGGGGNNGGGGTQGSTYTVSLFSSASGSSSYPSATLGQVGNPVLAVGNGVPSQGLLSPFAFTPGQITPITISIANTSTPGTEAVTSVDNANDIVGYVGWLNSNNIPYMYSAYVINMSGSGFAVLPGLVPNGVSTTGYNTASLATYISANGHYIVGYTELLDPTTGFREGSWATMWTLTNGQYTASNISTWQSATCVNNLGEALAGLGQVSLYENGTASSLSGLTVANAINNSGVVAGQTQGTSQLDAATWTAGQVTDLGNLGGTTYATSINDNGVVVGYGAIASGSQTTHAFIYENGAMTDLNTLVPSGSPTLYTATSVNNDGDIVGQSSSGAYYLTPVSQSSAAKARKIVKKR